MTNLFKRDALFRMVSSWEYFDKLTMYHRKDDLAFAASPLKSFTELDDGKFIVTSIDGDYKLLGYQQVK